MPKGKSLSYEQILSEFQKNEQVEDITILRAKFPNKKIDRVTVHKDLFFTEDKLAHFKFTARFRRDTPRTVESFTVEPQQLGWAKKCEVLICSIESGVINTRLRKVENGVFLTKVTVSIDEKNMWLFWMRGRIYVTDLNVKFGCTNQLSLTDIKRNSDWAKAFQKRILITPSQYRELKEKRLIAYVLGEGSEGSMLF